MSVDTSKHDALFRSFYLRREYGQLAARSRQAAEEALRPDPAATAAGPLSGARDALGLDSLLDVLLLPPPRTAAVRGGALGKTSTVANLRSSSQLRREQQQQEEAWRANCWRGLLYVRHHPSPWYGALFSFLIDFPERYPFQCPTLLLEHPLRSHPLLGRGRHHSRNADTLKGDTPSSASLNVSSTAPSFGFVIPFFDGVYSSVDPMQVSVMAQALRHLKRFFYPSAWPGWWWLGGGPTSGHSGSRAAVSGSGGEGLDSGANGSEATHLSRLSSPPSFPDSSRATEQQQQQHTQPHVSRMLARRDAKRYGLLHRGDVVLGRPYEDLVANDVTRRLLDLFREDVSAAEVQRKSALAAAGEGTKEEMWADSDDDDNDDADDAAVMRWSEWYGRVLLPQILSLP